MVIKSENYLEVFIEKLEKFGTEVKQ